MMIMRKKTYKKMIGGMIAGCGTSAVLGIAGLVTGLVTNNKLQKYQKENDSNIQRLNEDVEALRADALNHKRMTRQLQEVCKANGMLA